MGRTFKGGYAVYGHDVGIVLLDIAVPRAVGDIGNARSFAYPVDFEVADGLKGRDMHGPPSERLFEIVVSAAERLVARGVKGLGTSCGLLAVYHDQVAERVPVPMVTSSMLQIPLVLRLLPQEKKLGLITIDTRSLTEEHFTGVGVTPQERQRVVVVGMEGSQHFHPTITRNGPELDLELAAEEVMAAAHGLLEDHPEIGGFVLECTNLCVYAEQLREETGLPVWDAVGLVNWLEASLSTGG